MYTEQDYDIDQMYEYLSDAEYPEVKGNEGES